MADSRYIFNYLNDVWDLLPEEDQVRFGETWKAYEQTYGSVWMQQFDSDLANNIQGLPLYNILRWVEHFFDTGTQVLRAASYLSPQDLSKPIDLSARYLIKMAVDGGAPVEMDLRGLNPGATTLAEIVTRINLVLGAPIASPANSNQLLQFTSITKGPGSALSFYATSSPAHDASEALIGFDPVVDLPITFPKFPYAFQLADAHVVGVPVLQDTIHDEQLTVQLVQNIDYTVEFGTGVISFAVAPPASMWAKDTLINYETPYNNFGFLMDLYDQNTPNYLKAVKGLWFAFWNGPRPEFIRRSLYLLFGLPTASKPGTVTLVTATTITITYTDTTTESFEIPTNLNAVVAEGDIVETFQPLTDGIQVFDKVNYPGFLRKEVGRAGVKPFLTQFATRGTSPTTDESKALTLLEENTYLPQINVNSFISPNISLSNVNTFLRNIQPRSRTFLFQVLVGIFRDPIPLLDEGYTTETNAAYPNGIPSLGLHIVFDTTPNVDWNPNTMGNQATWDEAEDNPFTSLVLDDDVLLFGDFGTVNVYQSAVLIDSFSIQG